MKTEGFENLVIWKKARELVNQIYAITRKDKFSKDWALVDQIRKAAISVMSNIPEGFERGSNAEFMQFLYIAKASCGELRSQLMIAFDQGYINKDEFDDIYNLARKVAGIIGNFINYLKKTKMKGSKFKYALSNSLVEEQKSSSNNV
ncbi:MAG TPA: four helix bundle protein [candidate division Zixibacteria bacterium]